MTSVTIDLGNGAKKYNLTDRELAELRALLAPATRRGPHAAGRRAAKRATNGQAHPFGYPGEED